MKRNNFQISSNKQWATIFIHVSHHIYTHYFQQIGQWPMANLIFNRLVFHLPHQFLPTIPHSYIYIYTHASIGQWPTLFSTDHAHWSIKPPGQSLTKHKAYRRWKRERSTSAVKESVYRFLGLGVREMVGVLLLLPSHQRLEWGVGVKDITDLRAFGVWRDVPILPSRLKWSRRP